MAARFATDEDFNRGIVQGLLRLRPDFDRIAAGLAMPGMIVVEQRMPVGRAIDALLMLLDTTPDPSWYDQVLHLTPR